MANQYVNQQKRITFLSLHGNLTQVLKQVPDIDVTKHNQLVEYIYLLVDELFAKYPLNGDSELDDKKKLVISSNGEKVDEIPL